MNSKSYSELLGLLEACIAKFSVDDKEIADDISEDFGELLKVHTEEDSIAEIMERMSLNTEVGDKQKCIESLALLRVSIMNIESAFSNSADSLEKLIIAIRDE